MEKTAGELDLNGITFEDALNELEKRVEQLEKGDLSLEDSLECFKEGIQLVRFCRSKLKEAETTVSELLVQEEDDAVFEERWEPAEGLNDD